MADSSEPVTAAAELGVGAFPDDVTTDYSYVVDAWALDDVEDNSQHFLSSLLVFHGSLWK